MSAAPVLDFVYRYPFASAVGPAGQGVGLRLATCAADQQHPHFFEGRLRHPQQCGELLLVLSDVVRTHFFLPRPALLDPVVTSHEEVVRFEGFSGCCGVYARVDLPAEAFEAELAGRGTTNVDFNQPMRAALSRLRGRDDARLSVGQDAVTLERSGRAVVEKKVKLPVRWLKGFSEVQAYQPGLRPVLEVSGAEGRRFVRSLPRTGGPKRPVFVTLRGKGLGLTQREGRDTVRLHGTHRVRVLEPLMDSAERLTIWADEAGTSVWQVDVGPGACAGRFFLMLSPEVYRGFSGEGQILEKLAGGDWEDALPAVRAQLAWQAQIDPADLAAKAGCEPAQAEAALAVIGARGLAGYDLAAGRYFHREMPFDLTLVEKLQPRLQGARKLIDDGRVRVLHDHGGGACDLSVGGTGVEHHVRLRPDGDKCSCPWFSKHQGQRGPCKHVLAARLHVGSPEEEKRP